MKEIQTNCFCALAFLTLIYSSMKGGYPQQRRGLKSCAGSWKLQFFQWTAKIFQRRRHGCLRFKFGRYIPPKMGDSPRFCIFGRKFSDGKKIF